MSKLVVDSQELCNDGDLSPGSLRKMMHIVSPVAKARIAVQDCAAKRESPHFDQILSGLRRLCSVGGQAPRTPCRR